MFWKDVEFISSSADMVFGTGSESRATASRASPAFREKSKNGQKSRKFRTTFSLEEGMFRWLLEKIDST